jgi:hypothetical protein
MNKTQIKKIENKIVKNLNENYSLGFSRLTALPKYLRLKLNYDFITNVNYSLDTYFKEQVNYLQNMSEIEFLNFLSNN